MKYCLVPENDLKKLEKARIALYDILKDSGQLSSIQYSVSTIMHKLTCTNWVKVESEGDCMNCKNSSYTLQCNLPTLTPCPYIKE